jgi:hypothetical protein
MHIISLALQIVPAALNIAPAAFIIVPATTYGAMQALGVAWRNRKPSQSSGPRYSPLPDMDFGPASDGLIGNPPTSEIYEAAPAAVSSVVEAIAHAAGQVLHH